MWQVGAENSGNAAARTEMGSKGATAAQSCNEGLGAEERK